MSTTTKVYNGTKFPKNVKLPRRRSNGLYIIGDSTNIPKLTATEPVRGLKEKTQTNRYIRKGPLKGLPMFVMTLEERETCHGPKGERLPCFAHCYGNNMPFAVRFDHTSEGFLDVLEHDIDLLAKRNVNGFSVRLHELGDFYSLEYVAFWKRMMVKHDSLHIFGYTHKTGPIGDAIEKLYHDFFGRFVIRNSDDSMRKELRLSPYWTAKGSKRPSANYEGSGVVCPQQTGKSNSCADCGLCMNTKTDIAFIGH